MNLEELQFLQSKFINHLKALTEKGEVEWFRREADPEIVYCLYHNDLFVFELHDGTEENLHPFEKPHGITVKVRNLSLLWLDGLDDWEVVVSLVRGSKVDNSKLGDVRRSVLEALVSKMS